MEFQITLQLEVMPSLKEELLEIPEHHWKIDLNYQIQRNEVCHH